LFLKSLNPLYRIRELLAELKQAWQERDPAQRAALRAGQRQAAPFSRGKPKKDPNLRAARRGKDHGAHHQRPRPDHVDEVIEVAPPAPRLRRTFTVERVESQLAVSIYDISLGIDYPEELALEHL
jgi:flagellar motor protein MotB